MTAMNDSALAMNAVPGPKRASTRPASAGPKARAAVNWMELSRTALTRSSRGTSAGTKACQDVMLMPLATLPARSTATMLAGRAVPETHSVHSASATSICTVNVTMRTARRENRSAMAPDTGPTSTAGKKFMNAVNPSHVVDRVMT